MNKYKIGSLFGYLLGDGWLEKNKKIGGFSGSPEDLEKIKRALPSNNSLTNITPQKDIFGVGVAGEVIEKQNFLKISQNLFCNRPY